jgi:hypothetical protein
MLGAPSVFSRILLVAPMAMAAAPSSALAAAPSFSIRWEAPPQCPDEAHVQSAIDQLLAGAASSPTPVEARANVEQCGGDSWCVRLTTAQDGQRAERFLQAGSCRSLADATALILAVIMDPERGPERAETAMDADAPAAKAPAPAPAAAIAAPSSKEATGVSQPVLATRRVAIRAQASSDLGIVPQVAYGFTVSAALMLDAFRLEGYVARWAARTAYAGSTAPTSADVQLTVGGLRGCLVPWRGELEISGCSGLELGDLHRQVSPAGPEMTGILAGQGAGGAPFTVLTGAGLVVDSLWISATTSAHAFWRLTPALGLAIDVGLAFPLRRDALALGGPGVQAESAWVAGRASIGPEARF